jgi:WD40 repeat protein
MRYFRSAEKLLLLSSALFMTACSEPGAQGEDDTMEVFKGGLYWSAALSGDGKWILTGTTEMAQLWDVETGKEKVRFKGHKAEVTAAAFSPDGKRILTGGGVDEVIDNKRQDYSVRLWDRAKGEEIRAFEGHTTMVRRVQFSPDGKRIVTGASDPAPSGSARLWDASTGAQIHAFPQYALSTLNTTPAFNPDGDAILLATRLGAEIVDAETGRSISKIGVEGSRIGFNSAEFSPDGRFVLTSSSDNTARIWNAKTGREVKVLTGHTNFVLQACFSENGKKVVTASHDQTVRIWDAETGDELKLIRNSGSVGQARFVGGDKRVLAQWRSDADAKVVQGVSLWKIDTAREDLRVSGGRVMAVDPDGKKILVTDDLRGGQLWDASTGELVREYLRKP